MIARLRDLARKPELRAFAISFAPTLAALVFQLGTFVLMGRSLGAAQFGQLAAAMALTIVVVEVVGLGSGDILVRAIVQRPARFADYFGNTVWLGLISLPVCVGLAYLIATQLLHIAIAPLALAVSTRMKVSALAGMVLPYPTLSELVKRAAGSYFAPKLFENPWLRRLVRLVQHLP